jgi:hypothetical protein
MIKRVILPTAMALAAAAAPVQAIPAFARRYDVSCHFCHDGYPKLNSMGQRFRERGFRMDKEDPFDGDKWARTVPITLRASASHYFFEGDDTNSGFLKGISAGNLGRRLSYWVDDGLLITEGSDNFQHTRPDNAWARVELVRAGKLYLKGGRLELDLPFTQTRTPHLFSYDIYFATTGNESDAIGFFQDGVEVGGYLPQDWHWSAAVVAGRDRPGSEHVDTRTERFDGDVFLRLAKRINQHRAGVFAYIGRNFIATSTGTADDDLLRLGADASVWIRRLNLYGVAMYGRNSDSLPGPSGGAGRALSFSGGFLQADYRARDFLVLTLRGNLVSLPTGTTLASHQTYTSLFPGAQVFIRERLKLSFEYGFQNKDRSNFGAAQVDLAF